MIEGEKIDFRIPGYSRKHMLGKHMVGINRGSHVEFMILEQDVLLHYKNGKGYKKAECSLSRDEVADFIRILYDLWEKME